jgi:hypothetical protein
MWRMRIDPRSSFPTLALKINAVRKAAYECRRKPGFRDGEARLAPQRFYPRHDTQGALGGIADTPSCRALGARMAVTVCPEIGSGPRIV